MNMLKEKILEVLNENPLIFEPTFAVSETGAKCCPLQFNLGGLICRAAGYTPQTTDALKIKLPMNAPYIEKEWIDFEKSMSAGCTWAPAEDELLVMALARQLWAAEYGEDSAKYLAFYDKNQGIPGTCWWDDQRDITDVDIRAHLTDEWTVKINRSYKAPK